MKDCIFCKIIKGDIPNHTVYDDDSVLAFLDIAPRAKGHTVVIPKKHGKTMFDFDDILLEKLVLGVRNVMKRIDEVLHPDGYNVGWNHGSAGGQEIPHLHIHIMPRWNGDGGGNMHSIIDNSGNVEVEKVAKLFT